MSKRTQTKQQRRKDRQARKQRKDEARAARRAEALAKTQETPAFVEMMERQREAFKEKFGRDWTEGDPVFFDPTKDVPMPISDFQAGQVRTEIVSAMFRAGIDPAAAYAYSKAGILVTEDNEGLVDPGDLREWDKAVAEWEAMTESDRAAVIAVLKAGES